MEIELYFKRVEGNYIGLESIHGGDLYEIEDDMEKIRDENQRVILERIFQKKFRKGLSPGGKGQFSHYIQEVEMEQGI
jgi:hypothetical protein